MARRSRSGSPSQWDHPQREYGNRNGYDDRTRRRGSGLDLEEPRSMRENARDPKDRDEENFGRDEPDERNDRYKRRRYEDDEARDRDGYNYKRRSEPRERERDRDREKDRGRERSPDWDKRRRRDGDGDGNRDSRERDYATERRQGERRECEFASDRRRDYRDRRDERERNRDNQRPPTAGPSTTSRHHSRGPASPRPHSRSKSPSSDKGKEKEKDKSKPNFNQSGLLAAATNTVKLADGTATVLKYNEPPEARKPPVGWRLYVFKGKEQTDLLHISRQSCYLIGRDKNIVDIILDHPSCSKQHAVIQYRQVQEKDEFGSSKAVVKPFIIDLESTNSTFVNEEAIPQARYYELKMGDVIKFGMSTREYVLLSDDA